MDYERAFLLWSSEVSDGSNIIGGPELTGDRDPEPSLLIKTAWRDQSLQTVDMSTRLAARAYEIRGCHGQGYNPKTPFHSINFSPVFDRT
jgi:hypothetical protein